MQPVNAALQGLSCRVHDELSLFEYPTKDWVTPVRNPGGGSVANVVIVGAGQSGLGIAFGLKRERISGVVVLDARPSGLEGPWITYARMLTLRTLKFLTGPDLGLPGLTFRAWHEAQYGKRSWQDLVRIPRDEWMRYLVWFRDTLGIPVRNGVTLERIEPRDQLLALHLRGEGVAETMLTRKLVLATGIEGGGQRRIPMFVRDKLPRATWAHTRRADRPARGGHGRRLLGLRQRGDGTGKRRRAGGHLHPPVRVAGSEFVPRAGVLGLLA